MFKACIFDLDGVIVDTAKYHFIAWRQMANDLGFDFTEERNELLKGVSRIGSLNLILNWGGIEKSEEEKLQLATAKNEHYLQLIKSMNPSETLEGAREFVLKCREQGVRVGLGSASKNARSILKEVGMLDLFEVIVDGNNVTNGKPHPETFLKAAKALGTEPGESIVFEDAVKGVKAANIGGFYSVGVGNPAVLHEAIMVIGGFKDLSPNMVFDKLSSITKASEV